MRALTLALTLGLASCAPGAERERPLGRPDLDRMAAGATDLAKAIDPARGLIVIDYYQGGDIKDYRHLCGTELRERLPALAAQIASERSDWELFGVTCSEQPPPAQCVFHPGEVRDHGTRYLFVQSRGKRVLEGIIRYETGAMETAVQEHYVAEKLAEGRAGHCTRE